MASKRSGLLGMLFLLLFALVWPFTGYSVPILLIWLGVMLVFLARKRSLKKNVEQAPKGSEPSAGFSISIRPYTDEGKGLTANCDDYWVPSGRSVQLYGFEIGGLIYFGSGLKAVAKDEVEPALVNPKLAIGREAGDCHIRLLSYWPSYYDAALDARLAYLNWLSTGRSAPQADIGYVFLYFYGLERRALHDAMSSQKAKEEIPQIRDEIQRLLSIYGGNGSFRAYAGSLLNLLKAREAEKSSFSIASASLSHGEMTFEHLLCLAKHCAERRPLPAELAFIWMKENPGYRLRSPAFRLPEEFEKLFIAKYTERFGDGMILPAIEAKLSIAHKTASPTFGYRGDVFSASTDLPDIRTLTEPLPMLAEIAEDCCDRLASYSRMMDKKATDAGTILRLPSILWPDQQRQKLGQLVQLIPKTGEPYITSFRSFRSYLPDIGEIDRRDILEIYRLLEEIDLGIQPDVRYGGTIPSADEQVAVFTLPKRKAVKGEQSSDYVAAALALRLSAAAALADGVVSDTEKSFLERELDSWSYLGLDERVRLRAALELFLIAPPKITGLKKHIEQLDHDARELLADFISNVVRVDSVIDPREVASLEKLYKLLGLDIQKLYSRMHLGAMEPVSITGPRSRGEGYKIPDPAVDMPQNRIRLDQQKIELLQRDTERVSGILSRIFVDDEGIGVAGPESNITGLQGDEADQTLMGLALADSSFLRFLLTRPQWPRAELEQLASGRKLFLDGTLESINERSYNLFDKPLFEGQDPILLDADIVKEVLK